MPSKVGALRDQHGYNKFIVMPPEPMDKHLLYQKFKFNKNANWPSSYSNLDIKILKY